MASRRSCGLTGREFIAALVQNWLVEQGVEPVFIAKASPQQNCYVDRFNGSMLREVLNIEKFHSVLEAKVLIKHGLSSITAAARIAGWLARPRGLREAGPVTHPR